ncbi:MAG: glycosyltransferase family 4 protein, partial [Candidatus Aminicenantes bacterium]|nr:glycosyltransferase family 4 protein [Candidatus Aminicenantes bacterium]
MKILIVHNKYKLCGGEERVFNNEVRLLEKNGNKVEKIIVDNTEINTIFSIIRTGILSFYNPVSSKMIRNIVDEFDPDLIHVHNFFPLISPSVFFRRSRKTIPVVMTLHNYRLVCANAMLFRKNDICEKCVKKKIPLMGILYKCYRNSALQTLTVVLIVAFHKFIGTWKNRVNKYICLTEFQKRKILESSLNLKEDQIEVKTNFVFDQGFEIYKRNSFYIYVGRIDIEKGVETIVEAFRGTEYKLKIIGQGSNQEYIKNICESNENIEFLGACDHGFVMMQMK